VIPETDPASRPQGWEWLLAAAVVGLAGILAYPWGVSLITGLILGRPDRGNLIRLAVVATTLVLAGGAAATLPRLRPWRGWIGLGALAAFTIANLVVVIVSAADTPARPAALALYVGGSLTVVWGLLLGLWPLPWWQRGAVLGGCAGVLAAFLGLIRIDGLSGDAEVVFGWRRDAVPAALPTTVADTARDAGPPALEPGPHDFAGYLGPQRDGRVVGPPLDADWATHPPREVWRRAVGAGWGGFAVVGGLAFTQEQRGDREAVVCYDLDTGAERWIHSDPVRFDSSYGGPGPRATPTISAGRVYTMGATGRLTCLAADGTVVWGVDTVPGAVPPPPPAPGEDPAVETESVATGALLAHGMAGSPLVVGERVFVSPCGTDGRSLAAFDAATGAEIFRAGTKRASYASPALHPVAGAPCMLVFNEVGVAAHDPEDGAVRWGFPWGNDNFNNCAQPLVIDEHRVLLSTGYGTGSVLLDVSRDDTGAWRVAEVWRTRDFKSKFATPVRLGECVYGLDDGILACLDLATGKRRWKKGRYGHGQVLLVGDVLLVQTEAGPVVLVEPRPDGPVERGRIEALADKTWNTLTLAGDRLLVRNAVEAACYVVPLATPPAPLAARDAATPPGGL
jgi:outer membrane protein assembly factor BamB